MLKNTKFKIEVYPDYKNLEYFMKVQKLNWKQARWVLYLSRFDFTLKYVLEVRIEKTDKLSWRLDLKVRVENDNKNQKLIKDKWIRDMMEVIVEEPEIILVEKIKSAREKDEEVIKVVENRRRVSEEERKGVCAEG